MCGCVHMIDLIALLNRNWGQGDWLIETGGCPIRDHYRQVSLYTSLKQEKVQTILPAPQIATVHGVGMYCFDSYSRKGRFLQALFLSHTEVTKQALECFLW